jgi:hypothetical protein
MENNIGRKTSPYTPFHKCGCVFNRDVNGGNLRASGGQTKVTITVDLTGLIQVGP